MDLSMHAHLRFRNGQVSFANANFPRQPIEMAKTCSYYAEMLTQLRHQCNLGRCRLRSIKGWGCSHSLDKQQDFRIYQASTRDAGLRDVHAYTSLHMLILPLQHKRTGALRRVEACMQGSTLVGHGVGKSFKRIGISGN